MKPSDTALRDRIFERHLSSRRMSQNVVRRILRAQAQRLRVFDFDDTLVSSEGAVTVTKPTGETVEMDSATFAHFKPVEGDSIDFGAFNDVRNPRKIKKNFDTLKAAVQAGDRVVILTARAAGSISAVGKFLAHESVKGVDVFALGSSDPYDKARWIDHAIEEKAYNDVEFFDDSVANANAVAEHGKKLHSNIRFASHNTPHPHEPDYDGPAIPKHFKSDNPTRAVVEYKAKDKAKDKGKAPSCGDHPKSQYCHGGKTAMDSDHNAERKKQVLHRAKLLHNPKVIRYVEDELFEKLDQAGEAGGIWLETLESSFDRLEKKPDGVLKGFSARDFDDLFRALFGYARRG